ncbi:MAG TPA: hypothetical protein VGQ42_05545 [Candidatus Dormibacteraeota bacterium]|jgi:hypothetical protein|nr:hypothetical protein [Candidatus Dormibacteraeota bacterium]
MRCRASDLRPFSVVVFGDGELPELLLTCMQFRLVSDLASSGRARASHLMQLRRHLRQGRCTGCRGYLVGRLSERRSALRQRLE